MLREFIGASKRTIVLVLVLAILLPAMLATILTIGISRQNSRSMDVGNQASSLNWAGYVVASSFSSPQHDVTMVNGSWIIQTVAQSKGSTYSSQWVGIGGYFSSDSSLIQTGTESDFSGGKASYYAWYELLPAYETKISAFVVKQGDVINALVFLTSTTNHWNITLNDVTEHEHFSIIVNYASSQLSAEWIEERPALVFGRLAHLASLANFGTAYYGATYTSVLKTSYATIGGITQAIGLFANHQSITMADNFGKTLAAPSTLTSDGTSFTVKYYRSS